MKVKCITSAHTHIKEGQEYEVVREMGNYYVINTADGHVSYFKHCFEQASLDEQLLKAKAEVARLEEEIQKTKLKVGDKFRVTGGRSYIGSVLMLAKHLIGKQTYYSLVIMEGRPDSIGLSWTELTADINKVFGCTNPQNFERL